jgi:cysteine desulfurase/selenocysteine lyase
VGIMLDVEFNIATRTGLHCAPLVHQQIGTTPLHGGVRFAIGPFNTEEHVRTAVVAMQEISVLRQPRSA